jgi:hypothetical protein
MAQAIALVRNAAPLPFEALRMLFVSSCAAALIAAGHALPF